LAHALSDPVVSGSLSVSVERWPIAGTFTIARGSKTEATVVVATLTDANGRTGRGECVPYGRYGETVDSVLSAISAMTAAAGSGLDRAALGRAMPPGAARNALDCTLFDLQARCTGIPAWQLAGLPPPATLETAYTLSLGSAEAMAAAARAARARPLLKVKLGGADDPAAIAAVRQAVPNARLIVDANEGWTPQNLAVNLAACAAAGVSLIEQPLPAGRDDALSGLGSPVPICADESLHIGADLTSLAGRYGAVNIKLDKTGGLTEAAALLHAARKAGFRIMVGCMVATSLSMAPAALLAAGADFVDLDGPLLLARDREPGLRYEGSLVHPPEPTFWG
jgi:L-alanine-DL-glutamate epimerase-like enolase superfamily enzyme